YIKQDVIDVLTLGDSPLSLSGLAYKTQSGENKASQNGSTNIGEIGSVPSQKPVSETAAATIDVPQSSGPNKSDPKAGIKDIQPSFSFDFSIQLHDLKVGDDVKARFSPTYINEFDQKQMGASCIALGVVKEIICDEHSIKVHIYIT